MRKSGPPALEVYLKRFGSYATAGLKEVDVADVDKAIDAIRNRVVSLKTGPRKRWEKTPTDGQKKGRTTWESILCQGSFYTS